VKIGDLVKAIPLGTWDIDPEGNTHIGVVTKLAPSYDGPVSDRIVLLNFGDDDGIFRSNDWKFEVISENR
jgi:hypothetical protein